MRGLAWKNSVLACNIDTITDVLFREVDLALR